ncbi:RnfABCDGE type electron transport complex subunit G [candidate division WOR-3 bacterium]|nr:RnfABCDGE type electron transport complex subunit G [candidate division WOR-3 bacterium]
MLKLVFSLTIVTVICGSLLAIVYSVTKEPIQKAEIIQKGLKIESVFESLEPDNNPINAPYYFVTENGDTIQKGYLALKNGDTVGIALEDTGIGYGGKITVLTGIDLKDNSITSIEILSQSETPGLGAKVIDSTWREQFSGKSLDNSILVNGALSVKKDGGDIDAISGATISPRAVCFAVNQSLHLVDSLNTGESR